MNSTFPTLLAPFALTGMTIAPGIVENSVVGDGTGTAPVAGVGIGVDVPEVVPEGAGDTPGVDGVVGAGILVGAPGETAGVAGVTTSPETEGCDGIEGCASDGSDVAVGLGAESPPHATSTGIRSIAEIPIRLVAIFEIEKFLTLAPL